MKEKLKEKIKVVYATGIGTIASTVALGSTKVKAISSLEIDGMDGVAGTLRNFIKYIGLFFVAAGAVTAFYGAYKLFQSIKAQDSESRSTAMLEIASGLGAVAVGTGAAIFSSYIQA